MKYNKQKQNDFSPMLTIRSREIFCLQTTKMQISKNIVETTVENR